jgi:hypothetical protein
MMETLDHEMIPATRLGAIPPGAENDIRFSREAEKIWRYLANAWRDGHGFRRMVRRAQRRFSLSYHEAFEAMEAATAI